MEISIDQIDTWMASVIWPFCRIAALIMSLSVYGNRSIPARVRLVLALAVTVCTSPILPTMPHVPLYSVNSMLIIAQEMVIGVTLGFASRVLFEIFVVAGQLVSLQTGLGFASLVDPVNGQSVPLVGQLFLLLATLLFFLFDGHLLFIEVVVRSFESWPVATDSLARIDFFAIANWGQWLISAGLMIALAAVLALLMINISFGVLTRAAPQMNLFAIGFPITMIVGLILIWLLLVDIPSHFEYEFRRALDYSCSVVALSC